MAIKVLSRDEITTAKYNAVVQEYEDLAGEVVEQVKVALGHLVDIDHLYELKNYINQLLIDWEEIEIEDEEDE